MGPIVAIRKKNAERLRPTAPFFVEAMALITPPAVRRVLFAVSDVSEKRFSMVLLLFQPDAWV